MALGVQGGSFFGILRFKYPPFKIFGTPQGRGTNETSTKKLHCGDFEVTSGRDGEASS
jgi:hypothetical protein